MEPDVICRNNHYSSSLHVSAITRMDILKIVALLCLCRRVAGRGAERLRAGAPTAADVACAHRDISEALRSRWPDAEVAPFGSISSGLVVTGSDVDLHATLPADRATLLFPVKRTLEQYPHWFAQVRALPTAAMPHVTLMHRATNFRCDISFNNRAGVRKSDLVAYYMRDPTVLEMTTVLKYWVKVNKPQNRRRIMSSFGLVNLVVFYLQHLNMLLPVRALQERAADFVGDWNFGFNEVHYEPSNNYTLPELLLGFFNYYSDFDFDKFIVSTFAGGPIERRYFENVSTVPKLFDLYKRNAMASPLNVTAPVIIQDPFLHNTNVARDTKEEVLYKFKTDLKRAAVTLMNGGNRGDYIDLLFNTSERVQVNHLSVERSWNKSSTLCKCR